MQLNKIEDPRDPLYRLSRKECEYVARWQGIDEIKPGMPKPVMIAILKNHKVFDIRQIALPRLGSQRPAVTPPYPEWLAMITGKPPERNDPDRTIEVTEEQLLAAQFKVDQARPRPPSLLDMKRGELMKMAAGKGIRISIRDSKDDLVRKLAHGKDAS